MEFLLQLMAELFNIETEQPELSAVTEPVNNQINAGIIQPKPFGTLQPDTDLALEEGLIFNYVQFS